MSEPKPKEHKKLSVLLGETAGGAAVSLLFFAFLGAGLAITARVYEVVLAWLR